VFREALLDAMGSLDMARFTRRHPALLDTLLANVLDVLAAYETQKKDIMGPDGADGDQEQRDGEKTESQQDAPGSSGSDSQQDSDEQQDGDGGGAGGGSGSTQGDGQGTASEAAADAAAEAAEFSMDSSEQSAAETAAGEAVRDAVNAANAELAARLADEFKKAWDPVVDKLDAASKAFDGFDLDDLAEGPRGFDLSAGVWQATGWRELDALRRKLEARGSLEACLACCIPANASLSLYRSCASCATWCATWVAAAVAGRCVARRGRRRRARPPRA
jgi:hypothetical protein